MPQMLASLEVFELKKLHTVAVMMGTNDFSRGRSRKLTTLPEKLSCPLQEATVYLNSTILMICMMSYNMMPDAKGLSMNERVRLINGVLREIQRSSFLPLRLLDVPHVMEDSLPGECFSDDIQLDRPKGWKWLNSVFQRHIRNGFAGNWTFYHWFTPKASFLLSQTGGRQVGREN